MRVKIIEIVLRKDGFFHYNDLKIKAVYPGEGYAVIVFLETSPIDEDFEAYVWVPSAEEIEDVLRKMDKSDKLTHKLLGHGWNGRRPYWKLEDFM